MVLARQQRATRTLGHCVVALEVWRPDVQKVSPPPLSGRTQPFDVETQDLYGLLDSGDLIFRLADTVVSFNSTIVSNRQKRRLCRQSSRVQELWVIAFCLGLTTAQISSRWPEKPLFIFRLGSAAFAASDHVGDLQRRLGLGALRHHMLDLMVRLMQVNTDLAISAQSSLKIDQFTDEFPVGGAFPIISELAVAW